MPSRLQAKNVLRFQIKDLLAKKNYSGCCVTAGRCDRPKDFKYTNLYKYWGYRSVILQASSTFFNVKQCVINRASWKSVFISSSCCIFIYVFSSSTNKCITLVFNNRGFPVYFCFFQLIFVISLALQFRKYSQRNQSAVWPWLGEIKFLRFRKIELMFIFSAQSRCQR